MEGYNGGLRGLWKRKQYQRLGRVGDGVGEGAKKWGRRKGRRKTHHRVELATAAGRGDRTSTTKRRRFWRIKVAPRLGFLRLLVSPRRLLVRMRDAYVRMMLGFANPLVFSGGDMAATGFAPPAMKEYDEKVIVAVYKSLVAQGHVMATAAGDGGSQAAQRVPRGW